MSDPIPALVQRVYEGHTIRTVLIKGALWFVAADVCAVLGLRDTTSALKMVDAEDKRSFSRSEGPQFAQTFDPRVHTINLVNESGLYDLIFDSRKPEAKAFRRWVTSEVLPTINRDGGYIAPTASAVQIARLQEKIDYLDIRNLIATAMDYNPDSELARWVFAQMQNDFHEAVTGYTARQLVRTREIRMWTGKRGPTKKDRGVGKNYLTEKELRAEGYLSRIIVGKLGLRALGQPYTMRKFVYMVQDVIAENREELQEALMV